MKKYLYVKFIFAIVLLGVIGFAVISFLGNSLAQKHVESVYSSELYREATNIAQSRAAKYYQESVTVENIFANLKNVASYQDARICLISSEGEILLDTSLEFVPEEPIAIENFNPVFSNGSYYTIGSFFGEFSQEHLSVMAPVTLGMDVVGYVSLHLPMSIVTHQRDQIMNIIYLLFGLFMLILLAIIPVFSFMIYRPLQKIIQGADAFASGNLKYNIPLGKQDELGYLALTLNYMSDELAKTGDYQRKFIANVSHDFRSPLTSIKGYTEAILDGTIPPEMQEKYLNIVVYETDRLYKLTQSLITLNDLDKPGRQLDYSDFDINRIIKTTAATFEGTCREKRISIELLLTGQTLFVRADMGQIQQVLYNLIDNAIKFSPEDSVIKIESTLKHETVFISVKDSGCGIPKGSLGKIWDRFYKIDTSRGKDRKGTGLGLSIVKEIISSHQQNINVISTEGVGTEFIFTLAKSPEEDSKEE